MEVLEDASLPIPNQGNVTLVKGFGLVLLCQTGEHYTWILTDVKAPPSITTGCQTLKMQTRQTVRHVTSLFPVVARGVHDLEHSMYFQHRLATICIFNLSICTPHHFFRTLRQFFPRGFGPVANFALRKAHSQPTKSLIKPCIFRLWPIVISGHRKRCAAS